MCINSAILYIGFNETKMNPTHAAQKSVPSPSLLDRNVWQAHISPPFSTPDEEYIPNTSLPYGFADLPPEAVQDVGRYILETMLKNDGSIAALPARRCIQSIEEAARPAPLKPDENPFLGNAAASELVDTLPEILAAPEVKKYLASRDFSSSEAELQRVWPEIAKAYKQNVLSMVGAGLLPESVVERLEDALRTTGIQLVDDAVMSTLSRADGVYDNHNDTISIPPLALQAERRSLQHLFFHELTHKLSGGTFLHTPHVPLGVSRPRTGFGTDTKGGDHVYSGINEAVTEHVTCAIEGGDFLIIDPTHRKDGSSVYGAYRQTLAMAVEHSGDLVTPRHIVSAYFEDTGESGEIGELMHMIRCFIKAYGPHALRSLEETMQRARYYTNDNGDLREKLALCFSPPTFDEKGNYVYHGTINPSKMPGSEVFNGGFGGRK